jgi:hypothetical protein
MTGMPQILTIKLKQRLSFFLFDFFEMMILLSFFFALATKMHRDVRSALCQNFHQTLRKKN